MYFYLLISAGTTWMQEILPLVLNGGDLTPVHNIVNWDRVPWLEEKRLAEIVDRLTSPRSLVSHFPYNLMPPSFHTSKAKVNGSRLDNDISASKLSIKDTLHVYWPLSVVGDLCHEKPKGYLGVFLLLPPDGSIPRGSRNF